MSCFANLAVDNCKYRKEDTHRDCDPYPGRVSHAHTRLCIYIESTVMYMYSCIRVGSSGTGAYRVLHSSRP